MRRPRQSSTSTPDPFLRSTTDFSTRPTAFSPASAIASWDRSDLSVEASLDFATIFGNYRYAFWHDKPVTLFAGGGVAYIFYDSEIDTFSTFEDQTGFILALEPLVGVEFLADRNIRLGLEARYSAQLFSTDDFEELAAFTDVDMSGLYATFSVSFLFGD